MSNFLNVLVEFRGKKIYKVSGLLSGRIHNILNRADLNQKYIFEYIKESDLKQEPLDSNRFIKFYKLNS